MITIVESGLKFGPFHPNQVFQIEISANVRSRQGIKTCEFVWWKNRSTQLVLVEAKSSIPQPTSNPEAYNNFWQDVLEKFDNAMQLMLLATLRRPPQLHHELPAEMQALPWEQLKLVCYLVIPDAPNDVLQALTDRLRNEMKRQKRLWRQSELFVINANKARDASLTMAPH